jgi:hypothetical protein
VVYPVECRFPLSFPLLSVGLWGFRIVRFLVGALDGATVIQYPVPQPLTIPNVCIGEPEEFA